MKILTLIFFLNILLIGISFTILNSETVSLNYYLGTKTFPLSLLLAYTLLVGGMFVLIAATKFYLKSRKELFKLRSKLKALEKELKVKT